MRSMHLSEGAQEKIRVRVRILGPLKEVSDRDVFELEVGRGERLLAILRMLPEKLKDRIFDGEEIASDLLVLVNGVDISCLGTIKEVSVEEGSEIVLIPVIHGG